ncbi:MAG: ATP-binding cassette domain-containing protein, partial [Haliea sp.]|nr:ATP-binding cassette domain-containing protein [Haliea sp.]
MTTTATSGLTVSGVSKQFLLRSGQSLKALDEISFELQKTSVGILLGPSGCGKSTLLGSSRGWKLMI